MNICHDDVLEESERHIPCARGVEWHYELLYQAVESGFENLAGFLLDFWQFDLEFFNEKTRLSPLSCASKCGYLNIVNMLVKAGANIEHASLNNETDFPSYSGRSRKSSNYKRDLI